MAGSPKATLVVAVPTVTGREDTLERCEYAYRETTPTNVELEWWVMRDRATCGEVWNEVARKAKQAVVDCRASGAAVYLHCTADDLEPLPGWYEAAVGQVEQGCTPSALIFTARDGQPDQVESHGDWAARYPEARPTSMSRIPFCLPEQWIDIPPIHYYSDNAFTVAMNVQGIPIIAEPGYAFRHWWAQPGRIAANSPQWFAEQATYEAWARQLHASRSPLWS